MFVTVLGWLTRGMSINSQMSVVSSHSYFYSRDSLYPVTQLNSWTNDSSFLPCWTHIELIRQVWQVVYFLNLEFKKTHDSVPMGLCCFSSMDHFNLFVLILNVLLCSVLLIFFFRYFSFGVCVGQQDNKGVARVATKTWPAQQKDSIYTRKTSEKASLSTQPGSSYCTILKLCL